MIRNSHTAVLITTGLILALSPTPAYAGVGDPEFSRTQEEWEKLQDDVLEYEEIKDLVHEYNATVRKNRIDLASFRRDYGMSNEEWADRYRELADDLEGSLDYPDVDDSGYASVMTNIVTSEMQIESWREQADDALEDYYTYYYDISGAEGLLASQAQTSMINYYQNQLKLENDELQLRYMEELYRSIQVKQDLGLATEVDVLTASETLKNMKKTIQDDEAAIEQSRQQMLVLMGWKHDAQVDIREIPEIDFDRIIAMDPETDQEAAIANSFQMKSNLRKLENAHAQDNRENLQETVEESRRNIGASLAASYQNVLAAQSSYRLSQVQSELEERNFAKAELQYQLGSVSRMDYLQQQNAASQAQIQMETARLKLFQAIESYDWAVNGLAGT